MFKARRPPRKKEKIQPTHHLIIATNTLRVTVIRSKWAAFSTELSITSLSELGVEKARRPTYAWLPEISAPRSRNSQRYYSPSRVPLATRHRNTGLAHRKVNQWSCNSPQNPGIYRTRQNATAIWLMMGYLLWKIDNSLWRCLLVISSRRPPLSCHKSKKAAGKQHREEGKIEVIPMDLPEYQKSTIKVSKFQIVLWEEPWLFWWERSFSTGNRLLSLW